jgi:low temperature requirement protein LtrA
MTLALAANAALWWAYFAGEDERAARAFARAPPSMQPRLALVGYWYTHLVLVLGIVLLASGERRAVADPLGHAPSAAWLSAGGMALALAGTWAFRFALGVRPLAARAAAAILVLGVGAAGGVVGNAVVLPLVAAIATLALAVERTRRGQAATPFK